LNDDFSEHFELSHPLAEIQADIINSLYTPKKQAGDTVMRNATRIVKSLIEFRKHLPDKYQYYFGGNKDWLLDRKVKLVQDITEDEGLTLLKLGIARILLLRALFSSKELNYASRHQALVDGALPILKVTLSLILAPSSYHYLPQRHRHSQSTHPISRYRLLHLSYSLTHSCHGYSLWTHVPMRSFAP